MNSSEESQDSPVEIANLSGTVVNYDDVSNLVGKLLTYVDATYPDKEQREAKKTLIKREVYDWFRGLRQWAGYTNIEFRYGDDGKEPSTFEWTRGMSSATTSPSDPIVKFRANEISMTSGTNKRVVG